MHHCIIPGRGMCNAVKFYAVFISEYSLTIKFLDDTNLSLIADIE